MSMNSNNEKSSDNQLVAIKVLSKSKMLQSKQGLSSVLNEIRVHWGLEHCKSVLELLSIFEDKDMIFLVLEY